MFLLTTTILVSLLALPSLTMFTRPTYVPPGDKFYGSGINLLDCVSAVHAVPHFSNYRLDFEYLFVGGFSYAATNADYRVPRVITYGSCRLVVDVIDPTATVQRSWQQLATWFLVLLNACVDRGHGLGAIVENAGLQLSVFGTTSINAGFREKWDECLESAVRDRGRPKSLAQCIEPFIDVPGPDRWTRR